MFSLFDNQINFYDINFSIFNIIQVLLVKKYIIY